MPRTSEPGRTVSSRLLEVLFAFQPGHSVLSLADLVRRTGMPHATVRRLAVELVDSGALDRRPDGRFTVGLRLWQLGTLAPLTEPLRALAQPFLEDLYTALHQHVQLAVLDGQEAVIIERLSAPEALGLVSQVGGRLPLHCSGVGKVLLSHADPQLIETVLSGELRKYTPRSIVRADALREEIAECRRTGTATVRGELTPGADSVATRIVDSEGRVVAALSVVFRADLVKRQAVLPSVIASGLGISRLLGWRPGCRIQYI
ncbi:DNA-binding IclR family transcriptional regulator [Kibdelosporangium banguiense]|uniref:DNA-binding IclR family transcriptional regulator n=1 Tax=Kibdelosporangium banguiense TaxID=1365924 RepID=A0ABS4TS14_9PSEU|nr:IclR family transcriptional regulator [Kibdelosporangium banguiense]MBP2327187.1 DNA-binding IclR family transcriptional regulator [Kibdelosporangium banguiense]